MSEPIRSVSGNAVSRNLQFETDAIAERLANAALHRDPTVLHHAVSITVSGLENLLLEATRHSAASEREAREILDCVCEAVLIGDNSGFTHANRAALALFGSETLDELNRRLPARLVEMGIEGESPFSSALKGKSSRENLWLLHPVLGKKIYVRSAAVRLSSESARATASWVLVELEPPKPYHRETALAAFVISMAALTVLWFSSASDGLKIFLLAPTALVSLFLAHAVHAELRRNRATRCRSEKIEKELEREQIMKDTLVSALTHDIRGPISAARMSAQTLLKYPERVKTHQKLTARIVGSLDRADRMIRDLLDANRIRAGHRFPIQTEQVDLTQLASETLEELMVIYGERFRLFADRHVFGYWSREALKRILENLVVNAVRYGHPEKAITTSIEQKAESITLKVHNEGREISAAEQGRLFQLLRRPSSMDQSGWGIGLTLVRGIVEAHGGSVSVESSAFHGTTFVIRLPRDARKFEAPIESI